MLTNGNVKSLLIGDINVFQLDPRDFITLDDI